MVHSSLRRTGSRIAAAVVSLLVLASATAAQLPAPPPGRSPTPTITIDEPRPESYVTGPTRLAASVSPAGTAVTRVDFFVDGVRVCEVPRPPYACDWDGGTTVRPRMIRAVAVLAEGPRVATTVRTADLPTYSESTGVRVVLVPAVVTDSAGRFVKGLARDDFRLKENDVAQEISYFQSEEVPLEIVLAVDISESMTAAMPQLKASLRRFLTPLKATDRVTLVAFNHQVYVLQRATTDRDALGRAIDSLTPAGGTAVFDAVLTSLGLLGSEVQRRALIVFTDGDDQSSLAGAAPVERRLRASDAVAYFIAMGRDSSRGTSRRTVDGLAGASGGRVFPIDRASEIETALSAIRTELESQYLIGYMPSADAQDGTYRRITLTVARPRHVVRARDGYRAEPRR